MTIDQFIALAASIGACLAAIATFLTVGQMAMQRTASFHPELVVSRILFEGRAIFAGGLPTHWVAIDNADPNKSNNEESKFFFSVPLSNIGLGAAKNLKVVWEFPIEEFAVKIEGLARQTSVSANISFKNGMFSIESETLGTGTSIWKNQRVEHIDYVLPAAVQREATRLRLPHAYVMATSAFLYFSFIAKSKQISELPPLKVTLDYQDIADSTYHASFDIQMHVEMLSEPFIRAYLEAKRN
jgi:hypothetical protein